MIKTFRAIPEKQFKKYLKKNSISQSDITFDTINNYFKIPNMSYGIKTSLFVDSKSIELAENIVQEILLSKTKINLLLNNK